MVTAIGPLMAKPSMYMIAHGIIISNVTEQAIRESQQRRTNSHVISKLLSRDHWQTFPVCLQLEHTEATLVCSSSPGKEL